MLRSDPVALPGLAAMAVGFVAFLLALFAARRARRGDAASVETRARTSWAGIAIQGAGIFLAAFGPVRVTLDPLSAKAILVAVAVAAMMALAVTLFVAATRAMGANWSVVARTRGDHRLVTDGPFAFVRHPIYVAIALLMLSFAVAFGHTGQLPGAIVLFAVGTWLRIREEERLLRAAFGGDYDAYAARVRRFVPGVF